MRADDHINAHFRELVRVFHSLGVRIQLEFPAPVCMQRDDVRLLRLCRGDELFDERKIARGVVEAHLIQEPLLFIRTVVEVEGRAQLRDAHAADVQHERLRLLLRTAVRTGMRRAAAVKLVERCEQARLVIVIAVVIRRGEIADPGVHKPVQHPGGRVHARIAVCPGLAGQDLRLVAAEGRGGIDRRFQICRRQVGGQVEVRDGIEQVRRVRIADAVHCHAVRAVADGDAPLLAEAGRQRELQILLPEKLREVRSGHGLLQRVPPAFVAPEFLFLPRGIDAGARMRLAEAHRIFGGHRLEAGDGLPRDLTCVFHFRRPPYLCSESIERGLTPFGMGHT